MLIDFQFTNYKSFKNTADLDLTATKITEYPHHIVETAGEKILRIAAIYGANASGKSNIYKALDCMKYYVLNSFAFGSNKTDTDTTTNTQQTKKADPYLSTPTTPTTFEIWITLPGDEKEYSYNYGFSIYKNTITEEWLNYRSKTGREYKPIFYRETETPTTYHTIPKKYQENLNISLNNQTLIVSLGAKLKIEQLEKIYTWFTHLTLINFANPLENTSLTTHLPRGFIDNPKIRKNVIEYINTFDTSIQDFHIEKIKTPIGTERYEILTKHKTTPQGTETYLSFNDESAGTQKMFTLYTPLQTALNTGSALFIDELNDRLHPLLVRNIIQTFIDPERNKNNAQLIFTTHDVWQLSGKLFRRDEIWFTEKEKDGITTLYSLTDIKGENNEKIRNDADILKNYLKGKYGAIPELEKINQAGDTN